jgi:methionine sulfoxide reductase heme-binding subunit
MASPPTAGVGFIRLDQKDIMKQLLKLPWLRIFVHLLGCIPLIWLTFAFLTGRLTVNPVQELEHILGRIAIYWLAATLAITPLYQLTGWNTLRERRRAVGLYAFLYICLHVVTFLGLDYGFDLRQAWAQVTGKAFHIVGLVPLLLLIPLAITSFDYFIRRMRKNWKRLHWLVYPAALFSILHYALAQKGDLFTLRGAILKPLLWMLLALFLLTLRLPPMRRLLYRVKHWLGRLSL